jgi:peroxiredoxin
MKKQSLYLVIIVVIALAFTSCKKDNVTAPEPETGIKVGQAAPLFELNDNNSNMINLEDYRGKLVIVDFWASWCHFCRGENPELVALYDMYNSKGLEIIGVSLDENKQSWRDAVSEDGIEFIQVNDTGAFDSQIAMDYGITSIPTMFLLDEDGVILFITNDAAKLESIINLRLN